MKMLDLSGCLPKNTNGIRTTHTCELCGFEPKTKNKYREKQDHLVMKHFKEKIDKFFPHCRPYTCPSPDCGFTGKDKQALLRHYTGKHGILEQYLREALAENGIHIVPAETGGKRRSSVSGNGGSSPKMIKQQKLILNPSSPIDPTELLPTEPLPRQNADELRKEVEAMMASFQPQPIETLRVSGPQTQLITIPLHSAPPEQMRPVSLNITPIKVQLPQHPAPITVATTVNSGNVNLLNNVPISLPPLPQFILPPVTSITSSCIDSKSETSLSTTSVCNSDANMRASSPMSSESSASPLSDIPIDLATDINGLVTSAHHTSPIMVNPISSGVIENKEVMWGGGEGPAVVVEAADTLPITYIETIDGGYAALLDTIDYDLIIPSAASGIVDPLRERQLDFCMM